MNLHVPAYCSIILLSAPWASGVSASASSRNISLKGTLLSGAILANSLTLVLTDWSPRSSLAFISNRFLE